MFNYSFKIFSWQNKTVTENNVVNDVKVTVHQLLEKCKNKHFLFVLRSVNSFAMLEILSVLSLCMFRTVRLLNRSCFILERSHVFSLRAVKNNFSPAALVDGFMRISSHNMITSFIISRSGLGSSLILLWCHQSKNNHHPSTALVN